jgi:hypothetical protein
MSSGHVPIDIFKHPQVHGGLDCLIRVTPDAIQHLREYLEEEVGPRSAHLDWVSEDFAAIASDVHKSLGAPVITFTNSWDVFLQMSNTIETLL